MFIPESVWILLWLDWWWNFGESHKCAFQNLQYGVKYVHLCLFLPCNIPLNISCLMVLMWHMWSIIDPSHKSHNSLGQYPTMHLFVTEMCTHVHIPVTKWCIVRYGTGALWDLYNRSIVIHVALYWQCSQHGVRWWPGARTSAASPMM